LNDSFSSGYRAYVEKMLNVIKTISSSIYHIPQIGDNDDGHFFKPVLIDETHTRVGHILDIGDHYVNQKDKWPLNDPLFKIFLVKKQELANIVPKIISRVHAFENAGWVILEEGPVKIILCTGYSGAKFRGGHSHDDILSFTLYWKGFPVIVDPGTYVYTPDQHLRNKFRYAISHNQPQFNVNEKEWIHNKVFSPICMPDTKHSILFKEGNQIVLAEAKYNTYFSERKIEIVSNGTGLSVVDRLKGSISTEAVVSLCLHPDVSCEPYTDKQYELAVGEDKLIFRSGGIFRKVKSSYSDGYGQITETDWLKGEVGDFQLDLL